MPVISGCEPAEISAHTDSVCGTPQHESLDDLKEADKIAKVPGVRGLGGPEAGALVGPKGHLPDNFPAMEKKALGPLWNTRGHVKVGPFAPGWVPLPKKSV
jgi:hypothetical protein